MLPQALRIALWLALCLTLAAARPATAAPGAQDNTEAEVLAMRAKALFRAGQPAQAAELYLAAYAKSRVPLMLFNAARATEEAGNRAEARALFLEYSRLGGLSDAERRDATARAQALAQPQAAATPTPVRPEPPTAAPPTAAPPAAAPPPPVPQVTAPLLRADAPAPPPVAVATPVEAVRKPAAPSRPFPVWQTVGAAGLGAGALGAWLNASAKAREANQLTIYDESTKRLYLTLADSARAWQVAAIGAGVAAGGLAIWAVVAGTSTPASPKVALVPAWTPAGPAAAFAARW